MGDEAIHLLLIEDNPGDARLIEDMLTQDSGLSFELTWVDSLHAGIRHLDGTRADVVLLDLGLPDSNGLATLQSLLGYGSQVPALIVLSGLVDESIALQADDMRIVLRSGEYLHTLINQVLDLSKIEAGRMALAETGFALDRLLAELRDMFSIRAKDKALAPCQPRYRILVADDRREARQLLLRLLQPLGFELREAGNGRDALELWQAWRPHLIWMDMRMPHMSGCEAARRIKAHPQGKDTVIVALTASSFEEERAAILAAGCDDFLSKPFDEASFFSMLQQHLGVRFEFHDAAGAAPAPVPPPDAGALAALSPALSGELGQALTQLDPAAIGHAIGKLRVDDAALADSLQALANEFQYERMLQLLRAGAEERS